MATKVPTTLRLQGANAENAKVTVGLIDDDGRTYALPLTAFDISTLVSMLYAMRDKALKQAPGVGPEVMLPIAKLERFPADLNRRGFSEGVC